MDAETEGKRNLESTAKQDWYDGVNGAEKAELEEADADIAAGRVSQHEDVMTRMKARFKR